jgi:hypothetical protein
LPWPQWSDYNCDGVNDADQKTVICTQTPLLIDVGGGGFRLTDRAGGVDFDLDGDGRAERSPWTDPRGDEAWLTLDRNGNGRIDDGAELFGNWTPQPATVTDRNGFAALAVFDETSAGGNGDGWIDARDAVFSRLRLWHDANHNGLSEPTELITLSTAGLVRLSLHYREFLRVDEFGNWFRFGARIVDTRGRDVGPWAFDVFLDYPAGLIPPGPTRRAQRNR